jgi:hypothetical protein
MIVEKTLNSAQRDDLRVIAGMMIPASAEYDVPGADDIRIQADMLATLGPGHKTGRSRARSSRPPCGQAA